MPGSTQELCGTPKYADKLHLPFNLQGYFDYEEGLACAKQQNGRLSAVSFYKGRMQGQAVRSEESMSRIVVSGA